MDFECRRQNAQVGCIDRTGIDCSVREWVWGCLRSFLVPLPGVLSRLKFGRYVSARRTPVRAGTHFAPEFCLAVALERNTVQRPEGWI